MCTRTTANRSSHRTFGCIVCVCVIVYVLSVTPTSGHTNLRRIRNALMQPSQFFFSTSFFFSLSASSFHLSFILLYVVDFSEANPLCRRIKTKKTERREKKDGCCEEDKSYVIMRLRFLTWIVGLFREWRNEVIKTKRKDMFFL